jgi:hypothetical protein
MRYEKNGMIFFVVVDLICDVLIVVCLNSLPEAHHAGTRGYRAPEAL